MTVTARTFQVGDRGKPHVFTLVTIGYIVLYAVFPDTSDMANKKIQLTSFVES